MADSADENNNVIASGEGKATVESIKLRILAKKNTELFEQKREVELNMGYMRERFEGEIASEDKKIELFEDDVSTKAKKNIRVGKRTNF